MNKKILIISILFFICMTSAVFAVPDIQILSPSNTTYTDSKILINVTSNETVDFYIKGFRKDIYIKENTTDYESYIYGKTGTYNFTIYANNSNGVTSESIIYTINQPDNPINISSCGYLTSANTEYQLVNDISKQWGSCLRWGIPTENITLNLNNFKIEGYVGIGTECYYSKIGNGTIETTGSTIRIDYGHGCLWENLIIKSGRIGINFDWITTDFVFDNITLTASRAVQTPYYGSISMTMRNSFLTSPGTNSYGYNDAFYHHMSGPDTIVLENVTVSNYSKDIILGVVMATNYFDRNSVINTSSIDGYDLYGATRVYKQHLVIVNTTDQNGVGVPSVVEAMDSETNATYNPNETWIPDTSKYDLGANPTARVLISTNESGLAEVYLTEKVLILRTNSPLETEEACYCPYNLTARTRDANSSIEVDMEANSTINADIPITFPDIEPCTISQMLDLNNDSEVNINDAIIVLRYITGQSVEIDSEKSCKGINILPN